jgi:hypothetical protein
MNNEESAEGAAHGINQPYSASLRPWLNDSLATASAKRPNSGCFGRVVSQMRCLEQSMLGAIRLSKMYKLQHGDFNTG